MTSFDIRRQRLHNQHLARQTYQKPDDIVRHLGAVQAQDYPGATWALGMRLLGATDAGIEQAFTDGAILRTHVMRPTWHFVAPDDIRWLLSLTASRVHVANAFIYRQFELDHSSFALSNATIEDALRGGKHFTRTELASALERAGITAAGLRLGYIMMRAELDAIICSGPRRGKQFTYALLDERAPNARDLPHDEALAELTKRYFSSHGPATIQDFVWWSGLMVSDVKAGLEMSKSELTYEVVDGQTYWFAPLAATSAPAVDISQTAYLLSTFDEYGIGYKDRKELLDPSYTERAGNLPTVPFSAHIAIGGKILGAWKRTLTKREVILEAFYYRRLTEAESRALADEVDRYGSFLGLPATLYAGWVS